MVWLGLAVAAFLVACALLPVSVRLEYRGHGLRQRIRVEARVLGYPFRRRWQFAVPPVEHVLGGTPHHVSRMWQIAAGLGAVSLEGAVLLLRLARIRVRELRICAELGLGDAASTACAFGAMWSALALALATSQSVFSFQKTPVISLNPIFNRPLFNADVQCIATLYPGEIIFAVLYVAGRHLWRLAVAFFKALRLAAEERALQSRGVTGRE